MVVQNHRLTFGYLYIIAGDSVPAFRARLLWAETEALRELLRMLRELGSTLESVTLNQKLRDLVLEEIGKRENAS